MPIKAYLQSPPLRTTVNTHGLPPRRISALIIEEDLSDIDTPDSPWFLPANVYETITISQKEMPGDYNDDNTAIIAPIQLDIPTAADTSRRPSICLARLQTQGAEEADIKLPNYDYAHSMQTANRRGSTSSEVFFHSPLRRTRTFENYSSSGSSSSASGSSAASGYESPVFYPDSDCGCDDCECDDEETGISKMARSLPIPIQVPASKGSATRRRRGCFVQTDLKKKKVDEDEVMKDEDSDDEEAIGEESVEDWVQFAYTPSNNFETALISEVVRRRKSDERFAAIKTYGISYEKELENAQFSESHRRSQWMRDMVRWYPQECGGGHVLPCIS